MHWCHREKIPRNIFGFPDPYPNELLYSCLARYNVHLGMNDDRFAERLFNDRNIRPFIDVPDVIPILSQKLLPFKEFNILKILYENTFFPLYSPFEPESRKERLIFSMVDNPAPYRWHGANFITPSKIFNLDFMFCKKCNQENFAKYGEYYWVRDHQVKGVNVCVFHNCYLFKSKIRKYRFANDGSQKYHPCTPQTCNEDSLQKSDGKNLDFDMRLATYAHELLKMPQQISPTYWQWTHFYRDLALKFGAKKGKYFNQDLILRQLKKNLPVNYIVNNQKLDYSNLSKTFVSMFRKHRRPFSFLNHIIIWNAMCSELSVNNIFENVLSFPTTKMYVKPKIQTKNFTDEELYRYRIEWRELLNKHYKQGVKYVRESINGGLYARLYKYDRDWLLKTNHEYHLERKNYYKINWPLRDAYYANKLKFLLYYLQLEFQNCRFSKKFIISRSEWPSCIEKNLYRLPLCKEFLEKHSESVASFQIRRVMRVIICSKITFLENDENSFLMRSAGLNKKTITKEAAELIHWLKRFYLRYTNRDDLFSKILYRPDIKASLLNYRNLKKLLVSWDEKWLNYVFDGARVLPPKLGQVE